MELPREICPYDVGAMVGRPPSREAPVFGRKLAELRAKHGLTQVELAERLGVSQKTVTHYERRTSNPSLELINRLSTFFGVNPSDLVDVEAVPEVRRRHPGPRSRLEELVEQVRDFPRSEQQRIIDLIEDAVEGAKRRSRSDNAA